jgi:hypothetical protein
MSEEIAVEETPSPTPAVGGAAPEPELSLAERAAQFDAKAGQAAEQAEAKADPAKPGDPLEELIASKYGGDRAAFLQGLYHLQNSTASVHRQVEELKAREAARDAAPKPSLDELAASQPDIQQIDNQLAAIEQASGVLAANQRSIIEASVQLDAEINRLTGKSELADDYDKKLILQEINQLKGQKGALEHEYRSMHLQTTQFGIAKDNLLRTRQQELSHLQRRLGEEEKQSAEVSQFHEQTRSEFAGALNEELKAAGITDPEDKKFLAEYVHGRTLAHIRSLPKGAAPINMQEAVAFFSKAALSRLKVSAPTRSAKSEVSPQRTVRRAEDGSPEQGQGRVLTAKEWKARAAILLP